LAFKRMVQQIIYIQPSLDGAWIFLSRRSDRFINCIAVIPRVSRRNDLDDIWTNPGLCFHMDLWKSINTFCVTSIIRMYT
jgi:hypothetical protein